MAEAFGVAAGAVGIASIFTTCVDCFNYVQLGRQFERDFQQQLVTLRLLETRLSRWGAAVHIHDDPNLGNPNASPAEVDTAKMTLFQILLLFSDSEKKSKIFASSSAVYSSTDIQDPALAALVSTTSSIASERKKGPGFLKRARWALYDRGSLVDLTGGISGLLDSLENLFPAKEAQQRLADEDIRKITESVELKVLRVVTAGVDQLLQERMNSVSNEDGDIYESIVLSDRVRASNGPVIFGNGTETGSATDVVVHGPRTVYKSIQAKDDVKVHNGPMYNRSVFD
ncbi:small s protein [Colletotrichum kahawae]|uniref:Small s protein n=1 Tax=Colletotrichum kahawae TaxID=34407 RepID=A0AAD9YDX6_COLKA|nr:small s protein [Colletotrichum kahawae]